MANFAKIGLNNKVLQVIFIDNINSMTKEGVEDEAVGVEFCKNNFGHDVWLKTSFNTNANKHLGGGTPFRGNYAMVGGYYDSQLDAFITPKPFESWVLNTEYFLWEAPVVKPEDGKKYSWDESNVSWRVIT